MSILISDGYCSLTDMVIPAASAAGFSIGSTSADCMSSIKSYHPGKEKCTVKSFLKKGIKPGQDHYLWISIHKKTIRLEFGSRDSLCAIYLNGNYLGYALNRYRIGDPVKKIQQELGLWWCNVEEMFYPNTEKYPELVGLSFIGSSCESLEDDPDQRVSGFCVYNWDLQ